MVNTTNAPDSSEVDTILADDPTPAPTPDPRKAAFGGGDIPTGPIYLNQIPRISDIVGEDIEAGQIYRKVDDTSGHLVEVNTMQTIGSANRREGSFATVTHYMPVPDSMEIPGGRNSNYSYYAAVDETGGYRVYSRLEREGSNTAVNPLNLNYSRMNLEGDPVYLPKDDAVKMFTQFDSSAEFTGETNDVLNSSGVKQVNDSIAPNIKAQIRRAINNKDYSAAIDLIDNAVETATLSVDDQTKLVTYITKSQGNMFELNINERQAMASALFGALPKEDRNNELKESLMYYLETGRFDVLGSQGRSDQQTAQLNRVAPRLGQIITGVSAIDGGNLDFREDDDGLSDRKKLDAFIRELTTLRGAIFNTGDPVAVRQYTDTMASAYGKIVEDASDTRTGLITGIRRLFGFNPDANVPVGDIIPNIQGFDRNKVRTTDPNAVQFVRFVEPGGSRPQGDYTSIKELTNTVGTDGINYFRDIAAANSEYANLVTGQ
jgi:hypothetical protein